MIRRRNKKNSQIMLFFAHYEKTKVPALPLLSWLSKICIGKKWRWSRPTPTTR